MDRRRSDVRYYGSNLHLTLKGRRQSKAKWAYHAIRTVHKPPLLQVGLGTGLMI